MFETEDYRVSDIKVRAEKNGFKYGALLRRRDGTGEPFKMHSVTKDGKVWSLDRSGFGRGRKVGYVHNFMLDDGNTTSVVKPKVEKW